MHNDVPNELWTEIFLHGPREALMQLNLTHKRFNSLARPLLFRNFVFDPYEVGVPVGRLLQDEETLQDPDSFILKRLEFWTSSEIASYVHLCAVYRSRSLRGDSAPQHIWMSVTSTAATCELVGKLCRRLHHLVNLRHLKLSDIEYPALLLSSISVLPNLRYLEVRSCYPQEHEGTTDSRPHTATAALDSPPLCEATLEYSAWPASPGISAKHWYPLLRRDTLRKLSTSLHTWILSQILMGQPFMVVTHLELVVSVRRLLQNVQVFEKFPAMQSLAVVASTEPREPDGNGAFQDARSPVLASLGEYRGPPDLLKLFLPLSSLHRLFLSCDDVNHALLHLRLINGSNHITSLRVHFLDLTHEELRELCGFFPHLTDLRVKVTVPYWIEDDYEEYHLGKQTNFEAFDFLTELMESPPFPIGIEKISVRWKYEDDNSHLDDGAPDLKALEDEFLSRYPALKAMWIDGSPGFLYFWQLGISGVQYDSCSFDYNDDEEKWEKAHALRKDLEMRWDNM
ncbi:hypothetical protein R3P38DRAFT_2899163 [Favolaschia claudopus]|uniref:F-box domain-containing protein n=1 Tax=Favolaschia claudopus TaxID=2862362 RepID=A0AAW0CHN9_9AGAR